MKVLVISANRERLPDPVFPLGSAYVAEGLRREGHLCQVVDLAMENDWRRALAKTVEAFAPEVVGLSLRNVDNTAFPLAVSYLPAYRELACEVRAQVGGDVPLILGGSAFSLFPEAMMRLLGADFGIVGEGEIELPRLLKRLAEPGRLDKGQVFQGTPSPETFARLLPGRDLLAAGRYFQEGGLLNIQTKRGCVYSCSYCTYPQIEGWTVRLRPPEAVVDEIERCGREFGADYFFFVDSVFNYPEAHALAIADEIIRRRLAIRWTAYLAPLVSDVGVLKRFKESGCTAVDLGSDAASTVGLAALGKSFTRDDVMRCSRWCREAGLAFNHSLIFGVPGETRESVEETISAILETPPTAVTAMIGVRLYPETPLARRLIGEGWISEGEIGLEPVFYVAEEVRAWLPDRLGALADREQNWIVPGLARGMNQRYFERLRSRGIKGPLWRLFDERPPGG